jgi:hypothetical protein
MDEIPEKDFYHFRQRHHQPHQQQPYAVKTETTNGHLNHQSQQQQQQSTRRPSTQTPELSSINTKLYDTNSFTLSNKPSSVDSDHHQHPHLTSQSLYAHYDSQHVITTFINDINRVF